jgi:Xaa-Pro aminopeptidase
MKTRLDNLRKYLAAENIDAAFVAILDIDNTTMMPGVRYLTGFSGSTGAVFVTRKSSTFITDFRYADQARKEVQGSKVIISDRDPITSLEKISEARTKNLKIAVEANRLTVYQKKQLAAKLPDAVLIDYSDMIENLALCKDNREIADIKGAVKISDEAFGRILGYIRPGLTEKEVAAELEYQMKMLGSEREAFSTIVASGYRSAMPHGTASEKKLKKGEFITFDFGALVNGYCSDITRTVVLGKATSRQKKIYDIVARAQMAGIRKVKTGVHTRDVDKAARNVIKRSGYGKNFGHGTGHGIGLEVHAGPRVSPKGTQLLKTNMVITIEPGVYISGWGGVRIEDDVVVRPKGCVVLNKAPKNLLEL